MAKSIPAASLLLVILIACAAVAQAPRRQSGDARPSRETARLPYCAAPPPMNGRLDGACWRSAARFSNFLQVEPKANVPPSSRVVAYLAYGDHDLFVGFRVSEPAKQVRGYITKRDDIGNADFVAVGLDPMGTHQLLYAFFVTPAGVLADGTLTPQTGNVDFSWDAIWYGAAHRERNGYTATLAIPFRSLRYNRVGEQAWNFLFVRYVAAHNEDDVYPPMSVADFQSNMVARMAQAELRVAAPPREFAAIPYVTGRFNTRGEAQPNFYGGRGGADFVYAPTPNITLDGALIPDFSEVEADQPQVDINLNQPLYFPEKRPFFTQGATFFQTVGPSALFYSRKIVNPQAGLKATGEVGRWQFGLLAAQDRAQPGIVGAEDAADEVLRVKRLFGSGSDYLGFFSSFKASPQARNQVAGFDGDWHFARHWDWQAAAFGSHTAGANETQQAVSNIGPDSTHPGVTRSRGFSLATNLSGSGTDWGVFSQASAVSPLFDPQLGFQSRTDDKSVFVHAHYHWRPRHGLIQTVNYYTNHGRDSSYDFGFSRQFDNGGLNVQLPGQTFFGYEAGYTDAQWAHAFYKTPYQDVFFNTSYLRWLHASASWQWGPAIDYQRNELGYARTLNFDLGGDLRRFHTDFSGTGYRLYRSAAGPGVLSDLAWFWRTEFYLDKRTYLRNILFGSSSDKTLGESLLLRREIQPGTEFYVGVGSNYLRMQALAPATNLPLWRWILEQRGVFFKFSKRFDFLG
ncbi:MAG: DUF5916 domain-containing protein [Terriglobales bacterium]